MSFSREMAEAARHDPEKLDQMFAVIAREVLAKGGGRDWFDSLMRKHLHGLHTGGWTKDELKELRRKSRAVFNREKSAEPARLTAA